MQNFVTGCYEPSLAWFPEPGYGYFPVHRYTQDSVYDEAYFEKYKEYEHQDVGTKINQARVDLVTKYLTADAHILDVGVGCGTFVHSMNNATGYDVNPAGIQMLKETDRYVDMYNTTDLDINEIDAFSFWDSLEHIEDLLSVFEVLPEYVFVSVPIFKDLEHLQGSKHFRKDEHIHYWTEKAFISMFTANMFELLEVNDMETQIGRDSILTFVFKRIY